MTYTDTYSQPDAPDPILDEDVVSALAQRHGVELGSFVELDETGGEARAYVGRDVVVKTQRPHRLRPRTSLEKEAFILEELARQGVVGVARVLGYGREGSVEYEVLSRVSGVALGDAHLEDAARRAVLEALGATLRRIHDVDQSALVASGLVPGDGDREDLLARLRASFAGLGGVLEGAIDVATIEGRCLASFAELAGEFRPVTLHSNPGPEHCFVDPVTGDFSGLIDFGDAYRSHRALDLRSWSSLEDSRAMLAGYADAAPLPEGFLEIWRTGVVVTELRRVARGYATANDATRAIELLLSDSGG